jgi:hypothetical protein
MVSPVRAHVGPFHAEGLDGGRIAAGIGLLGIAAMGFGFLAYVSVFRSVTCSSVNPVSFCLAFTVAWGVALLGATVPLSVNLKRLAGFAAAALCGPAAFVLAQLLYKPHCPVVPFLRVVLH